MEVPARGPSENEGKNGDKSNPDWEQVPDEEAYGRDDVKKGIEARPSIDEAKLHQSTKLTYTAVGGFFFSVIIDVTMQYFKIDLSFKVTNIYLTGIIPFISIVVGVKSKGE